MTIVRVRVDCVVEFLLKLECRARDTQAQEAVYNFDYAGIETRRSRIPTAHISPILTLNTPLKIFLVSLVSFFFETCHDSLVFCIQALFNVLCCLFRTTADGENRVCEKWLYFEFWVYLVLLSTPCFVKFDLSFIISRERTPRVPLFISALGGASTVERLRSTLFHLDDNDRTTL